MRTEINIGDTLIQIQHSDRTVLDKSADSAICLIEPRRAPNTLTEILVRQPGQEARIAVHWTCEVDDRFQFLLIPETGVLFIGAEILSGVVHLHTRQVLDQKQVFLFWAFERKGAFVLELGEMTCFLYDLNGRLVGQVAVDPPYQVEETEAGIKFTSEVAGQQWLVYPAA